jgi:Flp pilus assembly protein TadD
MASENRAQEAAEYTTAGGIILHAGKFEEALALFTRALALDETNVRAHIGRSAALTQLGRPEEGFRAAQHALALTPDDALAWSALSYSLRRLGRIEEARRGYEKSLALNPNESRVLYNFACFWASVGNEEECRRYLAQAFPLVERHTLELADRDPDLAPYVRTAWFKKLLNQAKAAREGPSPP